MYCVVETFEDNEICLSAVPSSWVVNSQLYWPNTKNIHKLLADPRSKPDSKWSQQPCTIKRKNIKTLIMARSIESEMSVYSDTDAEDRDKLYKEEKRRHPVKSVMPRVNLNHMVIASNDIEGDISNTYSSDSGPAVHVVDDKADTDNIEDHDVNLPQNLLKEIFIKVVGLEETLQKCIKDINGLHIKFDHLEQKFLVAIRNVDITSNIEAKPENILDMEFPLNTVEDIENLEEKLGAPIFRKALISHMSLLGGTTGQMNGNKVAYKCIDAFFTRKILLRYSWTGTTKHKDEKKLSFLKFNRIVDAFSVVVNKADERFSRSNCEEFFKKILKNSNQRIKHKKMAQVATNDDEAARNLQIEVDEAVLALNGI